MRALNNLVGFNLPAESFVGKSLITILGELGLLTGLVLCLDAGDAVSYTSGQTWTDRSGAGNNYFRGATSSAAGDDPTFNGVAGGLSKNEFWSFDGGDFFGPTAARSYENTWHQNNALFTLLICANPISTAAHRWHNSSPAGGTSIGHRFFTFSNMTLAIDNGGGTAGTVLTEASPAGDIEAGVWQAFGVSIDEAAGAGFFISNNGINPFTATYASPSGSAQSHDSRIAASIVSGSPSGHVPSGTLMRSMLAWNGRALNEAELTIVQRAMMAPFTV